jgi:hypothetical protein
LPGEWSIDRARRNRHPTEPASLDPRRSSRDPVTISSCPRPARIDVDSTAFVSRTSELGGPHWLSPDGITFRAAQ